MPIIEWLILVVVVVMVITLVFYQLYTGVPPMPSSKRERQLAVTLLHEASMNPGILYELGCGWGGLLLKLAEAFPDRKIVGFELSWLPYWVARFRCRHLPHIKIYRKNFFSSPLPDAAAVVCYLMMGPMPELALHFDQYFSRKTYVVTIAFWLHDRKPILTETGQGPGVALYCWPCDKESGRE